MESVDHNNVSDIQMLNRVHTIVSRSIDVIETNKKDDPQIRELLGLVDRINKQKRLLAEGGEHDKV